MRGAQADLGRKFAAVAPQSEQLDAGAHLAGMRVHRVCRAVMAVDAAKPLGYQDFNRLADQFVSRIAKYLLRLGIDDRDPPHRIDDHDRVGRRLQEQPEPLLGEFEFSDSRLQLVDSHFRWRMLLDNCWLLRLHVPVPRVIAAGPREGGQYERAPQNNASDSRRRCAWPRAASLRPAGIAAGRAASRKSLRRRQFLSPIDRR